MSTSVSTITTGLDELTIRAADYGDRDELIRLAQRDSSAVPDGALVVGEIGGSIRAAVAVETGRTIADPFTRTSDLVALLHTRADQIGRARRRQLHLVARSTNVPPASRNANVPPASSGFALRGRPGQVAGRA